MRLLLFSDLHCNADAARRLVERAGPFDVLVGAGDFANMRHGIEICIDILRAAERPAVLVAGNGESFDELRAACRDWPPAHVLHGSGIEIGGIPFFGLGGAVPVTPFGDWSFDLTEQQAADLLSGCPERAVLVSHSPPKGTVDETATCPGLGSVAVRESILRTNPRLVVCGHIHASAGQVGRIGATSVVNAGPAGVEWALE